jgi:hypothetical protein
MAAKAGLLHSVVKVAAATAVFKVAVPQQLTQVLAAAALALVLL